MSFLLRDNSPQFILGAAGAASSTDVAMSQTPVLAGLAASKSRDAAMSQTPVVASLVSSSSLETNVAMSQTPVIAGLSATMFGSIDADLGDSAVVAGLLSSMSRDAAMSQTPVVASLASGTPPATVAMSQTPVVVWLSGLLSRRIVAEYSVSAGFESAMARSSTMSQTAVVASLVATNGDPVIPAIRASRAVFIQPSVMAVHIQPAANIIRLE